MLANFSCVYFLTNEFTVFENTSRNREGVIIGIFRLYLLGKSVYIGTYAQISGNITIGDNAVIGGWGNGFA